MLAVHMRREGGRTRRAEGGGKRGVERRCKGIARTIKLAGVGVVSELVVSYGDVV